MLLKLTVLSLLLTTSVPLSAEPIPGDIDGSGTVDFSDFLILAANFGMTGGGPPVRDTIIVRDTIEIFSVDTIIVRDTVTVRDTIRLTVRDTFINTVNDTITLVDTLTVTNTVHDTIWVILNPDDGSGSSGAPATPTQLASQLTGSTVMTLTWTAPDESNP